MSSRNEQRAINGFLQGKGLTTPAIQPGLGPSDHHFWADEKNARWAKIRIRYRNAISRSSEALTAASIVLCIRHSEAC